MSADTMICASNPRTDGAAWQPWEGNGPCQDCSQPNINWFAPNHVWNAVMGPDGGGLLCPSCFAIRAWDAGLDNTWRLMPETADDNAAYWSARQDEREKLRRDGFLIGNPEALPVEMRSS